MTINHPPTAIAEKPAGFVRAFRDDTIGAFGEIQRQYGDIVRLRFIGPLYAYMFYHPDHFKHVLVDNNKNYTKMPAPSFTVLQPLVGNGLLTSDGDFWLRQRRLAQPAFHRKRLAEFGRLMTNATSAMLDKWQHNQTFDIQAAMNLLTLEIVGKTLFGVDLTEDGGRIYAAVDAAGESIIKLSTNPLGIFAVRLPFLPTTRKLNGAVAEIDHVIERIIADRRADPRDHGDLLSMFMLAEDEATGERMTDRQLRDEVQTMVLAGHETTALLLTWTFYLLAKHPEVYERVMQEIADVVGSRSVTMDDMRDLTYIDQVLNETMRLYPPAYTMSRYCNEPDTIDGYEIAGKSVISMPTYYLHRHPDFWPDAERFDPERFSAENVATRHRFAFLPFGAGPRQCIGNRFAQMEAVLILVTVLQRYKLTVAADYVAELEPQITLRPKDGLPVTGLSRQRSLS
jgi:cytochrome P450